jgi:hypothetical protein
MFPFYNNLLASLTLYDTMKTHTVPNSITVQVVLTAGHAPKHCAVVRRDGQTLALYPAEWSNGRIPTMAQVSKDARWN